MDYCSECRRYLNGALVCPGCGACAPDIAPPGTGRSPADGWYGGAVSAGAHGAASRREFEWNGGAFPPAFDPASDPFAEEPVASAEAPADALRLRARPHHRRLGPEHRPRRPRTGLDLAGTALRAGALHRLRRGLTDP
ncbi:hypothetical protein ABT298_13000 [Streptomyces sp. NPDC001034]|uniref:SCO2400 family protein n=1 Tax=Streptomyces sp. NPDC001034 TaxID=3154375 RepID=UPI0033184681